jgi:hypothetical protein
MIGLTEREKSLATGNGTSGGSIVLAEVSAYWDNHPDGRPKLDAVISIKIADGTPAERLAKAQAIADWLGVPLDFRNETYFAQRRWTQDGESLTVDAHYTPDHDAAFAALTGQAAS